MSADATARRPYHRSFALSELASGSTKVARLLLWFRKPFYKAMLSLPLVVHEWAATFGQTIHLLRGLTDLNGA